ncbi:hypothetical protein [Pseudoxanthomonas sp. PXM01]|uniref:hypothetical protein n=1 Tax=Pseudoxanthomonas sp. PXM01 TaxID=2769295 RepID=UPI00177D7369|nr:hypothetical protein [Pseudoxanthomonas sp. PXM01]MBD9469799.1 hypothetical protein [Pseudoxanthomonas sp. PXM01]
MSPAPRRIPRWLLPVMLVVASACVLVIWVSLALYLQRQTGWMALLVALDVVLVLRLGGMAAGTRRAVLAAGVTVAISAMALWTVPATQLGFALGLSPWESALRLGAHHGWTLISLTTTPLDVVALVAAPLLAAWWTR